jgi:hypothetical protein
LVFEGDDLIDGHRFVATAKVDDLVAERFEGGDGAAGDVVDVGGFRVSP